MIKILKGFRHAEQFFGKDAGREKDLLATNPTEEQLADWQKRGLISGAVEESETSDDALLASMREQGDSMTNEILDLLESQVEDGETPVQVLRRIIGERDAFADEITVLQSQSQPSTSEGSVAQKQTPAEGNGQQSFPTETPVTAAELSEATNAKVALALLDKGYNTREKLRAATNDELKSIEGLGDGMVTKLRELAG